MGSTLFSLLLFFNFTYLFIYLFIYLPIIVNINILHLVFVGIHEQEISASSELYLSINILKHFLALNITI